MSLRGSKQQLTSMLLESGKHIDTDVQYFQAHNGTAFIPYLVDLFLHFTDNAFSICIYIPIYVFLCKAVFEMDVYNGVMQQWRVTRCSTVISSDKPNNSVSVYSN